MAMLEEALGCLKRWVPVLPVEKAARLSPHTRGELTDSHFSLKYYWLVVWNIFYFSIWNNNPNISQLTLICFRGVGIPPTRLVYPPVIKRSNGKSLN